MGVPYRALESEAPCPWPPGRNLGCLLGVEAGDRSLPSEGQRSPRPVSEGRVFQASDILVPPSSREWPNSGMATTIYVLNIFKLARLQIVIFFIKNWAYFFFLPCEYFGNIMQTSKERPLKIIPLLPTPVSLLCGSSSQSHPRYPCFCVSF